MEAGLYLGEGAEVMTEPTGSEWSSEILEKAGRMLSYCQRVQREGTKQEHFILVAGAVSIFGEMSVKEAAELVRANWDSLEEIAFVVDVLREIKDLEENA